MSKITGNEPAMPVVGRYADKNLLEANGLTIRQHFAAMAMQGILASLDNDTAIVGSFIADMSVRCADALIAELNKNEK